MRILPIVILAALFGCSNADSQHDGRKRSDTALPAAAPAGAFGDYWYQGKGEITRYALEQARYGEIHTGDAVLIFVTEDFLADKQVKLESDPTGRQVVPILKLNLTKKFNTGIYPYSMMTSVFSPVDVSARPHALKVTTSSQEWCGHTWAQLNYRGGHYDLSSFSYFEREGDQKLTIPVAALLEDEIWTRIRIAPGALPTGDVKIVPSTMSSRLRHIPLAAESATATLETLASDTGRSFMRYTVAYKGTERTISFEFEKSFPHAIVAWSETYRDGFGPKAELLTTRAVRTHSIMSDYWTKHSNADSALRRELGLEP